MKSVLRLLFPQWQGGLNPDYAFGAELLAHIAPGDSEIVRVPVDCDFDKQAEVVDGIMDGERLAKQAEAVKQILLERAPDALIVFGGDCSVSQVPFEYLHCKYGRKLGIIWLDAHPDLSTPADSSHLHELVLGNLIGRSQHKEITAVSEPFLLNQVIMAGLIREGLGDKRLLYAGMGLNIADPEVLAKDSSPVLKWIQKEGIEYVAVHWDLDVLSPCDFRSIYPAEPHTRPEDFRAAVGRMGLAETGRLLLDVSAQAEIVGLSITEHLPWDAINLRKTLKKIPLFSS